MTKLYVHGEPVADYVGRSTNPGDAEVTYRLMSDGVLLKQTVWTRYSACAGALLLASLGFRLPLEYER
ncbi:MAG: hypothetical protein ABSG07_14700 [Terriglobales bacterium]